MNSEDDVESRSPRSAKLRSRGMQIRSGRLYLHRYQLHTLKENQKQ